MSAAAAVITCGHDWRRRAPRGGDRPYATVSVQFEAVRKLLGNDQRAHLLP